jgi:hypothetical protein
MFNFPRKRVYSASLRITHNVSILLERCACIKVTHLTLNHGVARLLQAVHLPLRDEKRADRCVLCPAIQH